MSNLPYLPQFIDANALIAWLKPQHWIIPDPMFVKGTWHLTQPGWGFLQDKYQNMSVLCRGTFTASRILTMSKSKWPWHYMQGSRSNHVLTTFDPVAIMEWQLFDDIDNWFLFKKPT